jgi:quercetin dioxygenase-like cupin family protein
MSGEPFLIPPIAGAETRVSRGLRHRVRADQLKGTLAILEGTVVPGEFIPPHTHSREDEISCVIRGEITYRVGDQTFAARAGAYVVKPRGIVHGFWNATSEPAVIIEVVCPGAFEEFFDAFDNLPKGPNRQEAVAVLQKRFGMVVDFGLATEIARDNNLPLPFGPSPVSRQL